MEKKPRIEYVGQFYVHGSEARELAPKIRKPRTTLPKLNLDKIEKVYVNPVALCGLTVAVIVLIVMIIGGFRLSASWKEYNAASAVLTEVKRENARLDHKFHTSFDVEKVRDEAESKGMIPVSEAQTMSVRVTVPAPVKQRTAIDDFKWFMSGLFAE